MCIPIFEKPYEKDSVKTLLIYLNPEVEHYENKCVGVVGLLK